MLVYRLLFVLRVLLVTLVIGPFFLVLFCFSRLLERPVSLFIKIVSLTYKGALWTFGVPIRYEFETSLPRTGYVLVANHQSSLDVPLLGAMIGARSQTWLYWYKFTDKPIGCFLRLLGLPVGSPDIAANGRSLIQAIRRLKQRQEVVVIFPEGGRYTARTNTFLPGFQVLAQRASVPLIPVYIHNAQNVLPPHQLLPQFDTIVVKIGAPWMLSTDDTIAYEQMAALHAWFEAQDIQ